MPVVHVTGEVDLCTVELLHDALGSILETEREVVIDLADVGFIDLHGVERGLVDPARQAVRDGGRLTVRNPPRSARRILEVMDFDGLESPAGADEGGATSCDRRS